MPSIAPWMFALLISFPPVSEERGQLKIGSKSFTESVVLAEMAAHLAREHGLEVRHLRGLGGTRLLWEGLRSGQIDLYPEYTGTLIQEILAGEQIDDREGLAAALRQYGLRLGPPLGFNNTYVLGMRRAEAQRLRIVRIGDLRRHPELVLRFSNEFMQRGDGWPTLSRRYGLPQQDVRGLEHALAYEALQNGSIQVTDLYATDAKLEKLDLFRLEDDLNHFPRYDALFIYRAELEQSRPAFVSRLATLGNRIDADRMTGLNARVELDGQDESQVAADFLRETFGTEVTVSPRSLWKDILRYTLEHLRMVIVSLAAALLLAIPLGILAAHRRRLAQPILGVVGVIQTIPSIALLVLLIRPISYLTDELGYPQAVVALFLYSLLPIVRNTYTALISIPPALTESALALGLPPRFRLLRIELPLASRTILAGIKTAAVINVGFATLGGFIGAGGYGEPIFTGIRLNDYGIILQGALPAAALALLVQGLFELAERRLVPKGLR